MSLRRMSAGVFMACLLCILALIPVPFVAAENETGNTIHTDGRITGYSSNGVDNHSRQWTIEEGQWTSLVLECQQCTAEIDLAGTNYQTEDTLTVQATANGTVTLNINSPLEENVYYSIIESIDESFPTVRPSPSEAIVSRTIEHCSNINECIQPTKGHLNGIPNGEY